MDYKEKYLKYKIKYITLKNSIGGGKTKEEIAKEKEEKEIKIKSDLTTNSFIYVNDKTITKIKVLYDEPTKKYSIQTEDDPPKVLFNNLSQSVVIDKIKIKDLQDIIKIKNSKIIDNDLYTELPIDENKNMKFNINVNGSNISYKYITKTNAKEATPKQFFDPTKPIVLLANPNPIPESK